MCQNPERSAVDKWLLAGIGPRAISKRIALTRVQVKRHLEHCMASEGKEE